MSANLSITSEGVTEMFSGRGMVPWHGKGEIVHGLLKAEDAIKAAHLDWNVKAMPISCNGVELPFPSIITDGEGNQERDSKDCWQGIIREDTGKTLGVMRGRYETIQNKDCFDFMDTLAGEGLLKYDTAGALRGGKQVWMMAKYDGGIKINKDEHEQWLLLVTSHDGSYSLMVQWVTVRVVCNNTLTLALRGAKNQVKIRHTTKWEDKASEAQRVLGLTDQYFKKMKEALAGLGDDKLDKKDASIFTQLLFKAKDEKEVPTRTQNMRDAILKRYNCPETGTFGNTRWDMLNAVTDWVDHAQVLRGKNANRMESALLGSGASLKQEAFEYLTSDVPMKSLLEKNLKVVDTGSDTFQALLNK